MAKITALVEMTAGQMATDDVFVVVDVGAGVTKQIEGANIGDGVVVIANIYIPAGAMIPLSTDGATAGVNEYATNDVMQDYLAFVKATEQFSAFSMAFPESWNLGTIKARFYWAPGDSAASAGDTVEWEMAGLAIGDDDPIDAALGTGQVISDTVLAGVDADMHITDATPAITIGGTPTLLDQINLKISRNVSGTDDMTEDAWLFGVFLQLTLSEVVVSW